MPSCDEKQPPLNKIKYIELFTRVSTLMFNRQQNDSFLQDVLADIGETLEVSRVYIFYRRGKHHWFNAFEWTGENISAEIASLQDIDIRELGNDNMLHNMLHGEAILCNDTTQIEHGEQRDILLRQNIRALITVPLYYEGQVIGMFGLDQCYHIPQWSTSLLNTVVALGVFINSAYGYFKTRQTVLEKRVQLRTLFDIIPMPIYVSDMDDYSVLFCNKIIYQNFCTSDVLQERCHKIFQSLDSPCPFCTNKRLLTDGTPYIWYHHNPLLERDFQIIDSCITWEKKEHCRFSLALDITETLAIQRSHVLEQEANVAKGHFLANMSHELRTPLNGIVGLTHLASQANIDPHIKEYLDKIKLSSDNLLSVINETLNISDIDAGNIKFESRLFKLADVVHGVQAILQLAAENKGLLLDVSIDKSVPHMLMGDSLRLSQIIINLTNNAIKFTPKGHVNIAISIHAPSVHMQHSCGEKCAWLCIEVQDTGIGIPEDRIEKLFSEFTQVDSSTTRQYGGTGLGLSIVKRFVELMNGELHVHSVLGQGSTFTCILPFTMACEFDFGNKEENSVEDAKNTHDISGINVLLVEDNEINILIAREVLESYGCVVEAAENGLLALEKLKENSFDIILMDIQMPVLDGLETTRRIRALRHYDHIPILAMSAHAMTQDFERSLEAGMQDHITKPFIPEDLQQTIHSFIEKDFSFTAWQKKSMQQTV